MTPNEHDLFTEDVVDLLVELVGRQVVDDMDPMDPRHARFFEWLARDALLRQTAAERRETERQAVLFAERMMRRIADQRAAERVPVRCIDEAPMSYPAADDGGSHARERTKPWWDLAVAAGSGRDLWDEPPMAFVELPADVDDGRYVALSVAGDSMTPLLHTGDTILVRLGHEVIADHVIVARHPGQGYVVKQVGRVSSMRIELLSLNRDYAPLEIPNDAALVLGTVVLRWCSHDRGRVMA